MTASDVETFLGLLATIAVLTQLAARLGAPYPVVLVLGGLLLGAVPGLPTPRLEPGIFFFVFLPPLLYSEAFLYSTDAFRAAATEISLLAVGLVATTTIAVGAVAHVTAGIPWPAALVLGAVVGPTDPVAATAVVRRLAVPDRIVAILDGESLINDGTALVAYKLAIGAAGAAAFSLADGLAQFVWLTLGGVLVGTVVAAVAGIARRWITLPEVEVTLSLLVPFAAYLPAEHLGVSGVLAAVTAGLLIGRASDLAAPATRLRRHAFWEVLAFMLESLLFLLIGLTFRDVLDELGTIAVADVLGQAALLVATVVALRFLWMLLIPRSVSLFEPSRPAPPARELVVIGWCGMRGGVSLAAAMAIPLTVGGHPFPARAEIVFFSYIVVLATLVVPGLTLAPLVRRLGLEAPHDPSGVHARSHLLRAALDHLEELADNGELPEEVADRLRSLYEARLDGLARASSDAPGTTDPEDGSPDAVSARRGAVAAQRAALEELRAAEGLAPRLVRQIERELDQEELACLTDPDGELPPAQ